MWEFSFRKTSEVNVFHCNDKSLRLTSEQGNRKPLCTWKKRKTTSHVFLRIEGMLLRRRKEKKKTRKSSKRIYGLENSTVHISFSPPILFFIDKKSARKENIGYQISVLFLQIAKKRRNKKKREEEKESRKSCTRRIKFRRDTWVGWSWPPARRGAAWSCFCLAGRLKILKIALLFARLLSVHMSKIEEFSTSILLTPFFSFLSFIRSGKFEFYSWYCSVLMKNFKGELAFWPKTPILNILCFLETWKTTVQ